MSGPKTDLNSVLLSGKILKIYKIKFNIYFRILLNKFKYFFPKNILYYLKQFQSNYK